MKKFTVGCTFLVAAHTGLIFAQDAQNAYRMGHYAFAGQQLTNSDPVNEYYLGKLRLYGYGLLKNNPLALQYFTAAANKGYLPAEQFLARYALMGKNDPADALNWFKKAAAQGDNNAQMYCAAAYLFGYGATKNPDLARKYYIDAAKSGVPLAQYTLGKYFLESKDKNSKKLGLIWLTKAANLGSAQAQDALGVAEFLGIGGEQDPQKAKEWFDKAADQGLHLAMVHLGQLASSQKQYELAKDWLLKANTPANTQAQLALAQLYLVPNTPLFNPQEAFSLTLKAAQSNSSASVEAATQLARLYEQGLGTPQDKATADVWRKKAETLAKSKTPTQPNEVINWLTEGKTNQINQSSYALTGILTEWSNSNTKKNNQYNQAPEMPKLTVTELFKPKFDIIEPNSIPLSDYFENITNYTPTSSPTLENYPQYPLIASFDSLLRHDSFVLNHENDQHFIYPESFLNQVGTEPDSLVLLGLAHSDQNRRINYQTALLDLYNRAILGESAAQFELGQLYQAGVGVAKNAQQAINYYELAATQQEIRAEYNLGLLYLSGQTDPVDYKKGLDWLLDAAFKGNPYAQYALGSIYFRGLNDANNNVIIEPNLEQSIAMYHLASANDFAPAEYQLASVLLKQNLANLNVQAKTHRQHFIKQLYQAASEQGIAEARLPLAFYQAMSQNVSEQQQAFDTASEQAHKESPTAALLLGMLYDRGIGTARNNEEATKWYERAINQPVAAFILGTYASQGVEGPKNKEKAKGLLSFAADQNLAYADYNLAIFNYQNKEPFLPALLKAQQEGNPTAGILLADYYLNDSKSADNLTQAKDIYTHFAEKGEAQAATKLAYLFDKGMGTAANPHEAEKWYRIAATQNQPEAQFLLGEFYQAGRLDGQANIPEAKKWYTAAIKHGNKYAPISLGFIEETHDENYRQATANYQQAAVDQPIALYNMGLIKEYGKGEPVNYSAAIEFYTKAAQLGHSGAMTQLGLLNLNGLGVAKDASEAQSWFEKAAKQENSEALYQLGLMNNLGANGAKNETLAASYFEQASRLGHEQARMQLAHMLLTGLGVPQNEARALELYTEEAKNHNSDAAVALARIAIKQGQTQQALKWLDQAKQAGNQEAEQLANTLKSNAAANSSLTVSKEQ